jgi:hypothetical protein
VVPGYGGFGGGGGGGGGVLMGGRMGLSLLRRIEGDAN